MLSTQSLNLQQRVLDYLVARRVRITAVIAVGLVVKILLSRLTPHSLWNLRDPKSLIGFAAIVVGVGMRSWAAGILKKNAVLATTGPYACTRNPLYLGSLLVLVGFTVLLNIEMEFVVVSGPLAAVYLVQVLHEERVLNERFGKSWARHCATVPRFLPRRLSAAPLATWQAQNWLGNREYRAFTAVLLGLLGMELWRLN